MLYLAGALLAGLIIPLQTGVNTRLKVWLGSPFYASFVSFVVATLTMGVMLACFGFGDASVSLFELPWWIWLGGVFGTVVITGNIFLLPRLGGVQTVVLPAAGQIIMGLIIDQTALFSAAFVAIDVVRVIGACVVVAGIVCITRARVGGEVAKSGTGGLMLWRAFAVVLGASTACQTAVNGHFGSVLHSSVEASFLSCVVGTVLLAVISCVLALAGRDASRTRRVRAQKGVWWMWCGGVLGALMILLNASLAPLLGTGSEVVFALAGSIGFGSVMDQFGLFGLQKKPLTWQKMLGIALLLAGAAAVRFG